MRSQVVTVMRATIRRLWIQAPRLSKRNLRRQAEGQNEDAEQHQPGETEESYKDGARLDTLKFAWARQAYGDAVKASPTNTGVIVVYADDNYFDMEAPDAAHRGRP
jgi:hypothetical protein